MVLAATFRVENNTFTKQLRTVIQEDETTQTILREISQEDIKEFTKKDKFLLFQKRIYVPTKLRSKIIAEQYKLRIYKH